MKKKKQTIKRKPKIHKQSKKQRPQSNKQGRKKQASSVAKTKDTKLSAFKPSYWLFIAVIAIATLAVYLPAFDNEFVNWDDNGYVIENDAVRTFDLDGLLTEFHMGNYHPLTMVSLAIDYAFSDVQPPPPDEDYPVVDPTLFIVHNIVLHLLNTILVFFFVFFLTKFYFEKQSDKKGLNLQKYNPPLLIAFIASLLFGIHTLHVESVAWVSERKDVLYTFYFLASLISYLWYLKKQKVKYVVFSILLFILSLFAKGQAVSLAVTLVAIDFLLGRKLIGKKVIFEKIPYFVLAIILGIIAIMAQHAGEAIHDIREYAFYQRLIFASYAYIQYFVKMLVPINLAAIYPYPPLTEGALRADLWFYPIPVLLIIALFFYAVKRSRPVAFGILFFTLNIFLLLQLLPVGSAIMADRYTYIPSIGFFFLLAYGVIWLWQKIPLLKVPVIIVFAVFLIFIGYRTVEQADLWKDSLTLWSRTLKVSDIAVVGWNNFGSALEKSEDKTKSIEAFSYAVGSEPEEGNPIYTDPHAPKTLAIKAFSQAVKYKPDYVHAYYNRGTAKKDIGMDTLATKPDYGKQILNEALADFDKALKLDNKFVEAYHNRGIVKENLGDLEGAIKDYSKGLEIRPEMYKLYSSRGVAKGKAKRLEEAIKDFNRSLAIKPDNPEAYSNRGFAKVQLGKLEEGIKDYNKSLQLEPNSTEALYNRAIARFNTGDTVRSVADYQKLLQIDPEHADGLRQLARVYSTQGNSDKALELYDRLVRFNPTLQSYDLRAKARYKKGDWKGTVDDYTLIIQNQPNNPVAYYYRGMSYIKLGQRQAGCTDLQKAANLGLKEAPAEINKYCR